MKLTFVNNLWLCDQKNKRKNSATFEKLISFNVNVFILTMKGIIKSSPYLALMDQYSLLITHFSISLI